jgi:sulfotransferase family protein
MHNSASPTGPIFIIGIRSRSGTTYLSHLLRLHPDCCDVPAPIWEDFLLTHADLLAKYARSTYRHWHHWVIAEGVEEKLEDKLLQSIGDGLIAFLSSRVRSRRLVTKMPGVRNLPYFFKLFPQAHLLLLVRDGRAVVESAVKTSGYKPSSLRYELAMRSWARGAKAILRFAQATQSSSDYKYLIVRYEDIWNNLPEELSRIFTFLGLDSSTYDFNAATNLAIRGSSVFRGGEEKVQWKTPVEKTSEFDPMSRWNHWSPALHERFSWIAGEYLEPFHYQGKACKTSRPLWMIRNLVLDIIWPIRFSLHAVSRTLKRALKKCFGEERVSRVRRSIFTSRSWGRNPSKAMGSNS